MSDEENPCDGCRGQEVNYEYCHFCKYSGNPDAKKSQWKPNFQRMDNKVENLERMVQYYVKKCVEKDKS